MKWHEKNRLIGQEHAERIVLTYGPARLEVHLEQVRETVKHYRADVCLLRKEARNMAGALESWRREISYWRGLLDFVTPFRRACRELDQ